MGELMNAARKRPLQAATVFMVVLALNVGVTQLVGAATRNTSAPLKTVSNSAIKKWSGVDATDKVCTSVTTAVNMPSMSVPFTLGGTNPSKVLVMFQAEFLEESNGKVNIRLTIDGTAQTGPGASTAPLTVHQAGLNTNDATGYPVSTNGFNFISDALEPGAHTAAIQWFYVATGAANPTICADERSLVVLSK